MLIFSSSYHSKCRERIFKQKKNDLAAKRGFLKMGQITTKKNVHQWKITVEILMQISYHKNPLSINDVKRVLDKWRSFETEIRNRIFSSDL